MVIIMNIEVNEIKQNEFLSAFFMQKKGFLPMFLKYFDRVSPVFKTYSHFIKKAKIDSNSFFWIVCNGVRVGEVEIVFKENMVHISNLFVLKKYQNKGIAQSAIQTLEKRFSAYHLWHLYTILQESRNCHLYEKLGYNKTGVTHRINKRMTLVEYRKEL